jgi:2-oxoglutarate ferredoxin oxidoreductase subunit alpha
MLRARGVGIDYMRVRAFPFTEDVERFLEAHQVIFVVEQNRDAQLRALLTLETRVEKSKLQSLLHYNGLPISSKFIVEGVIAHLQPGTKSRAAAAQ